MRGEGEGEGKVVEQQTGALGNPCSSFSSSSSSLCIRWGFDKIFTLGNAVQDPCGHFITGFSAIFSVKIGGRGNLEVLRIRIRCFFAPDPDPG